MAQSAQSKATRQYEKKVGLISRSYKLKKSIVEAFKEACEKEGVSQASVLSAYMIEYAKAAGIELKEN
nr:MAG TPA: antitoxin [Caudoviricetes sp.]